MRNITDHKVNGLNEAINIAALDEPGSGGANHVYLITGEKMEISRDMLEKIPALPPPHAAICFQNGPVQEVGFNGISNEALLAVVIDRMRGFQGLNPLPAGSTAKFACRDNALALTHLEIAMMWLQKRTRDRMARDVEGTHKV